MKGLSMLIGDNHWDSSEAELVVPLVQEALNKMNIRNYPN